MAYARFGEDSDVYIFPSIKITCCACKLMPKTKLDVKGKKVDYNADFRCETEEEMIEHVREHMIAGHKVPDYALKQLKGK